MATTQDVKNYLAYWFQLGKKVVTNDGVATILPHEIFTSDRYSQEFEECWQKIITNASNYHLEGTHQTIGELLQAEWEMHPCARCDMPVPMRNIGMPPLVCTCHDLIGWPNTEIPAPRGPINNQNQLVAIRDRLKNVRVS
ncbi:hypothetical protein [Calothrix sp. UHCC 0171]|uniref:hypothetical protein n=1 Tax=Calothrix sp. UHCC 0171 TaxID=3110245 RepID=UPI002B21F428|nr:hypothetical protein [Calothrix sp. UHCC 0171]MEA5573345.1 hypothetical protein [Calothrix sp. UHCC 0171]